ncbi:hypothetical protein [Ralstonia holmesii]|uniref:hypothetical protein n=1 Tax=Ralstonia holmesii TaxID=3058602 RepID=UPI0028F69599|nr:hypothetical protein [Ralstonia sp. LMG 32967]CAJ0706003.1 hypothetical protein R11007_04747 [Ralstonia sp. LMG 32967]
MTQWNGLTADEKDRFVGEIVEHGTEFVAPLYAFVEEIAETVRQKNVHLRAQADAAPVAKWRRNALGGIEFTVLGDPHVTDEAELFLHPSLPAAQGLSDAVTALRDAIQDMRSIGHEVRESASLVGYFCNRLKQSAATVAEPSEAHFTEKQIHEAVTEGLHNWETQGGFLRDFIVDSIATRIHVAERDPWEHPFPVNPPKPAPVKPCQYPNCGCDSRAKCKSLFTGAPQAAQQQAEPVEDELPPMLPNVTHVVRRIRRCEGEVAAQAVLEHFAMEYARAAQSGQRAGVAEVSREKQKQIAWDAHVKAGLIPGANLYTSALMAVEAFAEHIAAPTQQQERSDGGAGE